VIRPGVAIVESPELAERWLEAWAAEHATGIVTAAPPAADWPFRYPLAPELPQAPVVLRVDAFDAAIVNLQTAGTLLVTTQRAYLEQEWTAVLEAHGRAWLLVGGIGQDDGALSVFAQAFRATDPSTRLAMCVDALQRGRTPGPLVATASVCMEVNDLDAAGRDLEEAIALAPSWAAAHYERGKLCLRRDDLTGAATAFQVAANLLPGFGPSWSNLGATLGELDRPAAALAAFERTLALDPMSAQALNNVGVVRRELGQLAAAEAAFRQVIQLTPDLAFGHYNLGHTLFLQGRFHAALSAYAEGQARDPGKNAVQASRLAVCQVATGDADGALRELRRATDGLPREYRRQLLADTTAILWAVVTQQPESTRWQSVQAWLEAELRG